MSQEQMRHRYDEAIRERTRLQEQNMKIIRELSESEHERVRTIEQMRADSERKIESFDKKATRGIDELKKKQHRLENLLKTNDITILNAERELAKEDESHTNPNRGRHSLL